MQDEKNLSEKESLDLITSMINQAKNSYHDTGIGLILWGCVISFCSLVTWTQVRFGHWMPFNVWWLTLIAILPQLYIIAKEKKRSIVKRHDDLAFDYIWTCFGISIFLLIFINGNISNDLFVDFGKQYNSHGVNAGGVFNSYIPSYFLLLYGMPTIITGGFTKYIYMLVGGIVCWVCCIISVFTNIEIDMLLTAFSATCAWLVPGIVLNRHYRKKRKEQHV